MTEWMWMLGHDDLVGDIESERIPYPQYGAPVLAAVCERMGWPIPDDPGVRRMIQGLACRDDCDEGCGR